MTDRAGTGCAGTDCAPTDCAPTDCAPTDCAPADCAGTGARWTELGEVRPPESVGAAGVLLRRWRADDAADLAAAVSASRAHLRPWMPWVGAYDEDPAGASAAFLAGIASAWTDGSACAYGLWTAGGRGPGPRLVGAVGLENRIGSAGLEIGYWLVPTATGRGLMTTAVRALAGHALALPPVSRLEIRHDVANARSGAVPARLGWRRVQELPRAAEAAGESGRTVVWETTG